MTVAVRYEREGAVALLTIANPAGNAASQAVRAGLVVSVRRVRL